MAPMTLPWYPAGSLRFKKSESDSASVELKRLIGRPPDIGRDPKIPK